MSRWLMKLFVFTSSVCGISLICGMSACVWAYDDDDLLCRPGWSLELYQQQIWQHNYDQRMSAAQYQYSLAYAAAAEQRSQELVRMARRAQFEKAARRREAIVAKRKAENAAKVAKNDGSAAKSAP